MALKRRQVAFDQRKNPNEIELDAIKQARRRGVIYKWIIVIALLSAPVFAIMASTSYSMSNEAVETAKKSSQANMSEKPGKQAALTEVSQWLTSEASPFPEGTRDLQWDGATETNSYTDSSSSAETPVRIEQWSHKFTFVTVSDNQPHKVAQLVTVTDGVAVATGDPSIIPADPEGDTSNDSDGAPEGYRTLEASSGLDDLVTSWAKAYVGADNSALTVLVGDPNDSHAYQTLNVGTFENASVNWSVWQDVKNTDDATSGEYGAVGVKISFTPYGQNEDGTKRQAASTSLTLLIDNPTSGSAKIVDWGANGDLKSLKPYRHAVDKSVLQNSVSDNDQSASDEQSETYTSDGTTGVADDAATAGN